MFILAVDVAPHFVFEIVPKANFDLAVEDHDSESYLSPPLVVDLEVESEFELVADFVNDSVVAVDFEADFEDGFVIEEKYIDSGIVVDLGIE